MKRERTTRRVEEARREAPGHAAMATRLDPERQGQVLTIPHGRLFPVGQSGTSPAQHGEEKDRR